MKTIKGAANIDKAIKSIATRGAKFESDIHVAAVSCLEHFKEHGDITLLTKLYKALPKGVKASRFIDWANAFGGCTWDATAEDKGNGGKGVFTKDTKKTMQLDKATETAPLSYNAPKADESTFDLKKKALALVKAAMGEKFSEEEILAAVRTAALEIRATSKAKPEEAPAVDNVEPMAKAA